jgi:uncharacterized protein
MAEKSLVEKTYDYVQQKLSADKTGHDWWHVYRVLRLARHIAAHEPAADTTVVDLGALLHDIADWKFHDGDLTAGPRATRVWLESQQAALELIDRVAYIVEHVSYRGGTNKHVMETIEGKIVQDADRLDAMGAVGIARTFTFGGAHGRTMYDPDYKPEKHQSFESYKKTISGGTTINHFYEKLLLLKDDLHTKTARAMAEDRHAFMEQFLAEFYAEWEGRR